MPNDMCLRDTVYHLAHDYPGGVPALAARMGKNATVLMHKLNPNNDTHHLTAHELDAIDDLTATRSIADYFAHKHGCFLVEIQQFDGLKESALIDAFLSVSRSWGEHCAEFQAAISDGKIDEREFKRLKKTGLKVIRKLVALTERIYQMVEG